MQVGKDVSEVTEDVASIAFLLAMVVSPSCVYRMYGLLLTILSHLPCWSRLLGLLRMILDECRTSCVSPIPP